LKVEGGHVLVRQPGPDQLWESVGPATVGNAVKALRELYPDATFAVDPRVARVPLSDMIVRANDPMTDLEAMRTSCGDRFSVHRGLKGNATWMLENNDLTVDPSTGEDREIECFNLTGYLQREKALDQEEANKKNRPVAGLADANQRRADFVAGLQDIIQRSITAFDPSISQPHFQFYPDAEMLIVIGPPRAIEVAAKVIHALPGQQASQFVPENPQLFQFVPPNAPAPGDKSNNLK
jgi:hypothetical protein